jgi:cytochrome b6-f complex iron-sulfur subunit
VTDPDRPEGAPSPERRSLLGWLTKGFLSLWALGAAAVGLSFLRAPASEKRPGEGLLRAGPLSTLPVGGSRFIRHGSEPLYLVRASETEVLALSAICTHLRCVLKWDDADGRLLCPCHAGSFDRTGNVLSGPPTRPLPRYRTEIRDDEILVRT